MVCSGFMCNWFSLTHIVLCINKAVKCFGNSLITDTEMCELIQLTVWKSTTALLNWWFQYSTVIMFHLNVHIRRKSQEAVILNVNYIIGLLNATFLSPFYDHLYLIVIQLNSWYSCSYLHVFQVLLSDNRLRKKESSDSPKSSKWLHCGGSHIML